VVDHLDVLGRPAGHVPIRHGESVKTVQARLGHASASETLDTYSHVWPDSEDRNRLAVEEVLGRRAEDWLRTEPGS
jgi:integrase